MITRAKRKLLERHPASLKTRMILLVCLLVLSLTLVSGGMYTAMIGEISLQPQTASQP